MPEDQRILFVDLSNSRGNEHTGGRKKVKSGVV